MMKRKYVILISCSIVMTFFFFLMAVTFTIDRVIKANTYIASEAIVTNVETSIYEVKPTYTIMFNVESEKVTVKTKLMNTQDVDDKIIIHYNPDDHNDVLERIGSGRIVAGYIFSIIGGVVIFLGYFYSKRDFKYSATSLKDSGMLVKGRDLRVKVYFINAYEKKFTIICRTFHYGTIFVFESKKLDFDPMIVMNRFNLNEINVYVKPGNFSRYLVDLDDIIEKHYLLSNNKEDNHLLFNNNNV